MITVTGGRQSHPPMPGVTPTEYPGPVNWTVDVPIDRLPELPPPLIRGDEHLHRPGYQAESGECIRYRDRQDIHTKRFHEGPRLTQRILQRLH